jgi:hypothetical protein
MGAVENCTPGGRNGKELTGRDEVKLTNAANFVGIAGGEQRRPAPGAYR